MRTFIIILILISLAGFAFAQDTETESETTPDPVILPFRTYHAKWLRYTNAHDGQPILAIAGVTKFAYRFISSEVGLGITELADMDTLASILAAAAYSDSAIAGSCKTDRLPGDLPDVFCQPGTSAMPFGHVILALYEPETNAIAALTTSIDNNAGGATYADWSPTPEAAPEPAAVGCGNYVAGQWIKAADFVNSAGLPVQGVNGGTTDYECVVAGGEAYFKAYALGGSGGKSSVNGAGDGGGTANAGAVGSQNRGIGGGSHTIEPLPKEPCTDPLGCDDDYIHE